jgi:hypothetical protein
LVLEQVFKHTNKVRAAVKDGLENLEGKLDDIEHCLKIYSAEERIANAVMTLYVSMLKAIEEVIGFYTRHICE